MGSLFLNFALRHSLMPKNGLFHSILCFTETYHGNWLCPGAKFKKGDPTSNSIYWQNIMNLPIETFLKLEKWHWFDFGINFSHFYIVSSNLLPNFLLAVTHSFFNIMLSVIPHTVLLNSDQEKKKLLHPKSIPTSQCYYCTLIFNNFEMLRRKLFKIKP